MTEPRTTTSRRGRGRLIEVLEPRWLMSTAVAGVSVDLTSAFNRSGIVVDHSAFSSTSGFDGSGAALSRTVLGTSKTWNGNTYAIGSASGNNVISTAGQMIALPAATDSSLTLLAAGVHGAQASEKFTVTYTDKTTQLFTQSFSDWAVASHFAGESTAITSSYRDLHGGTAQTGTYVVYGYTFTLNSAKTVKSILLPKDAHLDILAIDATPLVKLPPPPPPPDTQSPTMPTNLGTSTITAGSISVTWTAATDNVAVTKYLVYRNGLLAGTVAGNTTSFPDSGLDPNAGYTYDVVAVDAAGNESPASLVLAVSTLSTDVPVAPTVPGTWNLSFSDNFDALDPSIWAQRYWWNGNEGTQAAFDPSQTTISSNGVLSLTAVNNSEVDTNGVTDPYTSGLISTGGIDGVQAPSFSFTYGYVECRTKIAPGQGMWSALWMLPASYQDKYEIDVFENLGRAPTTFQGFVHNAPAYGGSGVALNFNMTAAYHTYGMDWEPDHITWYVDGVAVSTFANTAIIAQQAMYLMMNLDVGGSWAGPLTAGSPASSSWDVDYVRVWQHPGDTSTGLSSVVPPVNDNFAAKTVISGALVSVLGTNIGANKEPGEPNHAGNAGGASVWWTWVAPTDGTVSIDTQGSSFDTLLAVYTGNAIDGLTAMPGGSSVGDPTGTTVSPSSASFTVTAGTTYQIAVDGYAGATGQIVLNISLS